MATQPRDVPLTLSVSTVGTGEITALKDDLLKLAKTGGDAAPEFARLANEVERLADQTKVVTGVKVLAQEVEQLATAQKLAAEKARVLTDEMSDMGAKAQVTVESEKALRVELQASQRALFDKRQALATLKNETSAADKETSAYSQQVKALNAEIIAGKASHRNLSDELRTVKSAITEAGAAEDQLSKKVQIANRESLHSVSALEAKNVALRESKAAMQATGIAADTVVAAEFELVQAYTQLARETDKVRVAQDKATAAAESAAIEAKHLAAVQRVAADDYAQFWLKALAEKDAAELKSVATQKATAASAKEAGDAIKNALGTVGVRSAEMIQQEIVKVKLALSTLSTSGTMTGAELAGAFRKGQAQVKTLERELRALNGTLTMTDKAAGLFKTTMGQFTVASLAANAVMALAQAGMQLARSFVEALKQGDQLKRGLNAVYKDAGVTAQQIDFLRKASAESGVAVGSLSQEFVKFSASMFYANIPMKQSNELFRAVTAASASLGLGAEATAGSLNALGQMASKGVVSMEEMRQQLGDRLPGAMGLAAKGMNITEAELIKLISSGSLATRDFIVPLTNGLSHLRGETDNITSAWSRFKGLLTTTSQSAGDAAWTRILLVGIKALSIGVGALGLGLNQITESLVLAAEGVTAFFARLMGDKDAFKFFAERVDAAATRLGKMNDAFSEMVSPSNAAASAVKGAGLVITATAEETRKAEQAVVSMTAANIKSVSALELAGDATLNAAGNIVKYRLKADELLAALEQGTEGFKVSAKAAKEHGDQLVVLAKLSGDSTIIRKAEAEAAELEVAATAKTMASQQAEIDLLVVQRKHIVELSDARGDNAGEIKASVAEIDKKLAKGLPELEQLTQLTEKLRTEALARKLAAEALKDTSAQLDANRVAMVAAQAELDRLIALEKTGVDVRGDMRVATEAIATATFKYNDSLKDSVSLLQVDTQLRKSNLDLSVAQATASQSHYTALANEARATGDSSLATMYDVQAKQEAIKVLQIKLKINELENAAALAEIDLKRKAIPLHDAEREAKLKLLDIETQIVKIKSLSNQATQDQIRAIENEISAIRNGTAARTTGTSSIQADTDTRNANTNAINSQTAALRAAADALAERTSRPKSNAEKVSAENPYGLTNDGLKANKDGSAAGSFNSITANGDLARLREKRSKGTLSADDLSSAQTAVSQAKIGAEWLRAMQNSVGIGSISTEALTSSNAATIESRMILEAVQSLSKKAEQGTAKGGTPGQTVNINLNGKSTAINVGSSADSDALVALMKQLGGVANRTS